MTVLSGVNRQVLSSLCALRGVKFYDNDIEKSIEALAKVLMTDSRKIEKKDRCVKSKGFRDDGGVFLYSLNAPTLVTVSAGHSKPSLILSMNAASHGMHFHLTFTFTSVRLLVSRVCPLLLHFLSIVSTLPSLCSARSELQVLSDSARAMAEFVVQFSPSLSPAEPQSVARFIVTAGGLLRANCLDTLLSWTLPTKYMHTLWTSSGRPRLFFKFPLSVMLDRLRSSRVLQRQRVNLCLS